MLSLKRLLIKLCGRTNFRIVETTTPEFAVSGGVQQALSANCTGGIGYIEYVL